MPGVCPSLGCYGYPTHSAPVLVASPSFQATSQSTTFINEIHLPSLGRVSFRTHCSVNAEVSFAALRWSSNNLYHLNNKQLHLITHCLTWHCKCTNILTSRPTNKWYRRKDVTKAKIVKSWGWLEHPDRTRWKVHSVTISLLVQIGHLAQWYCLLLRPELIWYFSFIILLNSVSPVTVE